MVTKMLIFATIEKPHMKKKLSSQICMESTVTVKDLSIKTWLLNFLLCSQPTTTIVFPSLLSTLAWRLAHCGVSLGTL